MTKRVFAVLLATVIVLVSLTACGGGGIEKKILGSWVPAGDVEGYLTFYSGGTLTATENGETAETGSWEVDGTTLTMTLYGSTVSAEVTEISNDSMTWLANGNEVELLKMSD